MEVNDKLNNIKKQFDENKCSHIFLIETDNIDNGLLDIKKMIGNILNADDIIKNQINEESYIELTVIKPTGNFIIKDDILRLQEQIKTKPLLSDKRFYIISNADRLNEPAANKLLKTIEEPQEGIYGFLLAENLSLLLPTIKSRCQILQLFYSNKSKIPEYSKEELNAAKEIIRIIESGKYKDYVILKNSNTIGKDFIKANGKSIANIIKDYYNSSNSAAKNNIIDETTALIKKLNTPYECIAKAKMLNKLLNIITLNMNAELLLDKIIIDLKDVKKDANSWN